MPEKEQRIFEKLIYLFRKKEGIHPIIKFNKILFWIIPFVFLFIFIPDSYAISTPWLHVDGKWIKDPADNIVVLRGINIIDVKRYGDGSRPQIQWIIDSLTDANSGWHTHVIRFPVLPSIWQSTGASTYFNNYLKPAVDYCVEKQVYCIISWHYVSDYDTPEIDISTRNFWSYVAPKLKDYPNVLFELFNEPMAPDEWDKDWTTWKNIAQPWVDLIRSYAPKNLIIIGSPHWSEFVRYAPDDPFVGSNLLYSVHIYPNFGDWGETLWNEMFGNAAESVPVFVTEWGYEYPAPGKEYEGTTSGFGQAFKTYMDNHPYIHWTAWVYDYDWTPVMVDANYNLLDDDSHNGVFTQEWLYQHRNDNLPRTVDIDFNNDLRADFKDFLIMASQWLQAPGEPSADVAPSGGDNVVNNLDLKLFVGYWLSKYGLADFTGDGTVDYKDLKKLMDNWLWTGQTGAIPEDIFKDGRVDFLDLAKFAEFW